MNEKALRAGSHCVGVELCRWSDPPQAENPAKQDSFLYVHTNVAVRNFTKKLLNIYE